MLALPDLRGVSPPQEGGGAGGPIFRRHAAWTAHLDGVDGAAIAAVRLKPHFRLALDGMDGVDGPIFFTLKRKGVGHCGTRAALWESRGAGKEGERGEDLALQLLT